MQSRDEERRFFQRQTGLLARRHRVQVSDSSWIPDALVTTREFQMIIPKSLLHILLETDSLEQVLAIHWFPEKLNALDPRIRVVARYPVLAEKPAHWVRITLLPSLWESDLNSQDRGDPVLKRHPHGTITYKPSLAVVNGQVVDDDDLVDQETAQSRTELRWRVFSRRIDNEDEGALGPSSYVIKDRNGRIYSFRVRRDRESPPFTKAALLAQISDTTRVFDSTRDRQGPRSLFRWMQANNDRVYCFVFASNEGCLCITMQSLYTTEKGISGLGRILLLSPEQDPQDGSLETSPSELFLVSPLEHDPQGGTPQGVLRKKSIFVNLYDTQLIFKLRDLASPLLLSRPETPCHYPKIAIKAVFGLDERDSSSTVLIIAKSRTDVWTIDLNDTRVILLESRSRVRYRPA